MDQQLILDAMVALDATPPRIQSLLRMPYPQAVKALDDIKAEARKLYKKKAFEWHPDRNPEDLNAEARFKALGMVLADLEKLRLQPPRPQPVMVRYVHFPNTSPFGSSVTYTTTSATTTTASTATGWVRVIF